MALRSFSRSKNRIQGESLRVIFSGERTLPDCIRITNESRGHLGQAQVSSLALWSLKRKVVPKILLSRFPKRSKTSLVSNDSGLFSPRRDLCFAPPSQNVFLRFIVSRADAAGVPCCHTFCPSRAALIFNYGNLISESQSQASATTTKYEFLSPLSFFSPFRRL